MARTQQEDEATNSRALYSNEAGNGQFIRVNKEYFEGLLLDLHNTKDLIRQYEKANSKKEEEEAIQRVKEEAIKREVDKARAIKQQLKEQLKQVNQQIKVLEKSMQNVT